MKKSLADKLKDHKVTVDNIELFWDNMGPSILGKIEEEKKKHKAFAWWWLGGSAFVLVLVGILLYLVIPFSPISGFGPVVKELSTGIQDDKENQNKSTRSLASSKVGQAAALKSSSVIEGHEEAVVSSDYKDQNDDLPFSRELENISRKVSGSLSNSSRNMLPAESNAFEVQGLVLLPISESVNTSSWKLESRPGTPYDTKNPTGEELSSRFTNSYIDALNSLPLKRSESLKSSVVSRLLAPSKVEIIVSRSNKNAISIETGVTLSNLGSSYPHANNKFGHYTNINYHRLLSDHFSIHGGLLYEDYRFRNSFETSDNIKIYAPNTPQTVYVVNGRVEYVTTVDSISGVSKRSFAHHNQMRIISVPLALCYHQRLGQFDLLLEAGTVISLFQQSEGLVSDQSFNISDYNEQTLALFRPSFGMGLSYPIWNRVRGSISLNSSFVRPNYDLETNHIVWMHRAGIGLSYEF